MKNHISTPLKIPMTIGRILNPNEKQTKKVYFIPKSFLGGEQLSYPDGQEGVVPKDLHITLPFYDAL